MREHVDYIMPGITLREVSNVGKKRSAEGAAKDLSKRATFPNPISPILHPIAVPLEVLLNDLLLLCDVAVTPECIKSEQCPQVPIPKVTFAHDFDSDVPHPPRQLLHQGQ